MKEINLAFTRADGTAEIQGGVHKGKRVRVCFGNPFHPNSLYGEEPLLIPWSMRHMQKQAQLAQNHTFPEVGEKLLDGIRAFPKAADVDVFPFAEVNRRLWEPGWSYKCLSGGRASTKSASVAQYLLILGAMKQISFLCVRQHFTNIADSVKEAFSQWVEELGLQDFYEIGERKVVGKNGTYFPFKGIDKDPDAVKSAAGFDGIWIEEGHGIGQVPWTKAIDTIREEGSVVIVTQNVVSEDYPVYEFFYKNPPPDALLIPSGYEDAPWLTWRTRNRIAQMREHDYLLYKHEYGGEPQMNPEARLLRNWRVGDLDQEIENADYAPIYGLDIGGSAPTAFIEAFVMPPQSEGGPRRLYVSEERYEKNVETDDTLAFCYGDAPNGEWDNRKNYQGVDYASLYPVVIDDPQWKVGGFMGNRGIRAVKAYKPKQSVISGLRELNNFDVVVHPSCVNFIREATHYQCLVDRITGKVHPDIIPPRQECHGIDALRYAMDGYRRGVFPPSRLTEDE